jgi:DmsE family decaheme c-type cytochrome
MKKVIRPIVLLVALIAMTAAAQDSHQDSRQDSGMDRRLEAQFTADGKESCLRCHAGEKMTLMAETAHGNLDNPHTPWAQKGCESCHGPGSLHVSRARGGRGFPSLVTFGRDESLEKQTQACIDCHGRDIGGLPGMDWTGSGHDTGSITCIDCHTAHAVGNPLKDQKRQQDSCTKCHSKQVANHPRYEDKGIVFDKLTCYDCHDVHQLSREP